MKRLSVILVGVLLWTSVLPVQAATVQDCRLEVQNALENIMGLPGRTELHGYLQQMSDLMSTQTPTYLLLDEVQQIARDARLEMTSLCQELGQIRQLNEFYVGAYHLHQCQVLPQDVSDAGSLAGISEFCSVQSERLLNVFLDRLRDYVTRQAVRTSIEPVVAKMRALNGRLTSLLTSYSRLVNNFYTFSFRLGDTIVGDSD